MLTSEARARRAMADLLSTSRCDDACCTTLKRAARLAGVSIVAATVGAFGFSAIADPECDCLTYQGAQYGLPEALRIVSACVTVTDGDIGQVVVGKSSKQMVPHARAVDEPDALAWAAAQTLIKSRLPFDRTSIDVYQHMKDACHDFRTYARKPESWSL